MTLAILAGGAGSRMGAAKAGIDIAGTPILRWLIGKIQWRGPTLLVTAPGREHPPGAAAFDREVSDPVAGLGPLRGLLTALENSHTPIVVVATVDMPDVRSSHLEWIAGQLERDSTSRGIMLARESGSGRAIEPFPSAWRTSAAPILAEQLSQQRRAIQGLLQIDGFRAVDAPRDWPARTWTNLNTPEDLELFLRSGVGDDLK